MKSLFLKISAIFMVAILMLSSFSLEKHFCGDSLRDIAINGETSKCCESSENTNSHNLSFNKEDCCKTESNFQKASFVDSASKVKLQKKQLILLASFVQNFLNLDYTINSHTFSNFIEKPPILFHNRQILFQRFLI